MDYEILLDGRTVIHTSSHEEALLLIEKIYSKYGDTVVASKRTLSEYWKKYRSKTCYRFSPYIHDETGEVSKVHCSYCSKEWYIENRYRVFEFDEVFGVDLGEFDAGFDDTKAALAALF